MAPMKTPGNHTTTSRITNNSKLIKKNEKELSLEDDTSDSKVTPAETEKVANIKLDESPGESGSEKIAEKPVKKKEN